MIIFDNDPDSISYEHKQSIDDCWFSFQNLDLAQINQKYTYTWASMAQRLLLCRALSISSIKITWQKTRGVISAKHPIKFSLCPLN